MIRILSILTLGVILLTNKYNTHFLIEKDVMSTVIFNDIPAMRLGFFQLTDSLFITQDVRTNKDYMLMYNYKDDNLFTQFGSTGKGPNELITPLFNRIDATSNQFHLFDPNMRKIYICDINTFSCEPEEIVNLKDVDLRFIFDAKKLNSELIVATGLLKEGLFASIDIEKENKIEYFGEFPLSPSGIDGYILSDINNGGIRLSPSGKYLTFSAINFGYICCYKINENKFEKIWEHWITEPKYETENGKVYFKSDNILGFMDVAVTEEYVYAVYHGKKMRAIRSKNAEESPETVMKFAIKDGTPLAKYKTDTPITRIGISPDGQVYCIAKPLGYKLVKLNLDNQH